MDVKYLQHLKSFHEIIKSAQHFPMDVQAAFFSIALRLQFSILPKPTLLSPPSRTLTRC
jgi:hypothetical protein